MTSYSKIPIKKFWVLIVVFAISVIPLGTMGSSQIHAQSSPEIVDFPCPVVNGDGNTILSYSDLNPIRNHPVTGFNDNGIGIDLGYYGPAISNEGSPNLVDFKCNTLWLNASISGEVNAYHQTVSCNGTNVTDYVLEITNESGLAVRYRHLERYVDPEGNTLSAQEINGTTVEAGGFVAVMGNRGCTEGTGFVHLHFEVLKNGNRLKYTPNHGTQAELNYPNEWEFGAVTSSPQTVTYKPFAGDFNGDGITDFLSATVSDSEGRLEWDVRLGRDEGLFSGGIWNEGEISENAQLFTGDFDGDGNTDVVAAIPNGSGTLDWEFLESNGASESFTNSTNWALNWGDPNADFYVGEFTGDGKDDIVMAKPFDSAGGLRWTLLKSSGFSFQNHGVWRSNWGNEGRLFLVGDFYDDNQSDGILKEDMDEIALATPIDSAGRLKWSVMRTKATLDGFESTWIWNSNWGNSARDFYVGDFTGDGKDDITMPTPYDSEGRLQWSVMKSTGDMFQSTGVIWNSNWGNDGRDFYVGDYDSDGKDDLVIATPYDSEGRLRWSIAESTGIAFESTGVWNINWANHGRQFLTGDFNGDDRSDILVALPSSTQKFRFSTMLSKEKPWLGISKQWEDNWGNAGRDFYVGDFTGDGKDDVAMGVALQSGSLNWSVLKANSSGTGFETSQSAWASSWGDTSADFYVGEFTGDGKDDIVMAQPFDSAGRLRWTLLKSSGSSFQDQGVWRDNWGNQGRLFLVGDFYDDDPSDGILEEDMDEIALATPIDSAGRLKWSVMRTKSTLDGFESTWIWNSNWGNSARDFYVGDFTGDGKDDITMTTPIDSYGRLQWSVMKSTGDMFQSTGVIWNSNWGNDGRDFYIGDFTGDGKFDVMNFINQPYFNFLLSDGASFTSSAYL